MLRRSRGRTGPGLVETMARVAASATTATVSTSIDSKQPATEAETHDRVASLRSEMEVLQAREALAIHRDAGQVLGQLQQLAQLKDAGALTNTEFEAAKARVLKP